MPTATQNAQPLVHAATEHFDPRVDVYVNRAAAFARPILGHLRKFVHAIVPEVTETIKWGRPFFVLQGIIFCNMSAFNAHCSFGFWSSKMTELLAGNGIDGTGSSGSLGKIESLEDLPANRVFAGYLETAAKLVASGEYGPGLMAGEAGKARKAGKSVKAPLPVPPELTAALAESQAAQANLEAYPPSCRREYIEWITSAKRPETRRKRLLAAVENIAGNKRINDSYR